MSPQRVRMSSSPLRNERQQQKKNRQCPRQTRGKRQVRNFLVLKNGEPARKRSPKGKRFLSLSTDGRLGSSHATSNSAVLNRGSGGGGGGGSSSRNFLQLESLEIKELKIQVTQQANLIT